MIIVHSVTMDSSFNHLFCFNVGFPVAQLVKNLPVMQETWVQPLGWEEFPKSRKIPWIYGVTKSRTQLSNFHFHFCFNKFHKGFGATHKVITQINLKNKVWQKRTRSRKASDVKQTEVGAQSIRQGLHTSSDLCPDRVSELLCHQLSDVSEEESQDTRGLKINNKIETAIAQEMQKLFLTLKLMRDLFHKSSL